MPFSPLSQLIHQFEQQPRWRSRHQFRMVQQNWSQLVGVAVACHARPVRIERQILYVAVANPMWGQTLTLERSTLLQKLQQFHIDLSDIRFSTGDWYRRAAKTSTGQMPSAPPADLPNWLRQHPSFEPDAALQPSQTEHQTPLESFQQWASLNQQMARHQPLCPACQCPCPEGELRRWSVCCVCAAKKFTGK
jgi:predicted nucleic acid-binding Zn ribbon protein